MKYLDYSFDVLYHMNFGMQAQIVPIFPKTSASPIQTPLEYNSPSLISHFFCNVKVALQEEWPFLKEGGGEIQ